MSEASGEGSESVLLSRAQAGDLAAFDQLVTAHREKVYMQAYMICRNAEDAQDLCQEAFVRAWRALRSFDDRQPLSAWLRRIVTNAAIDLCRKQARRGQVEMPSEMGAWGLENSSRSLSAMDRPSLLLERKELAARLESAFSALSPEQRAVVGMRDIEGLSYREIADAMRCSVGTVMSRLFYARKKLQSLLSDLRP